MGLIDQIAAAVPRHEDAELELFGQKFPVRVLIMSMADYDARMKRIQQTGSVSELADCFFMPDGSPAFGPDDFGKLPATAVKALMDLFRRVNTGFDPAKNG